MSVCPKCGAEIEKNANFCENCGTAIPQSDEHLQKNASVMGDKNVVAGDVVAQKIDGDNVQNKIDGDVLCDENVLQGDQKNLRKDSASSPMIGDKNVVAGDVIGQKIAGDNVQNKIMGNVIYNVVQDETKRTAPCAICGRRITGDMGHTCPRCGNTVCSECYDESQRCCEKCAPKAYDEIVVDKSGYGDVRTITEALQSAKDDSIIRVRFGHYDENLIINKPLTIVGEPNKKGEKPVICGFYEEGADVIAIDARATLKNLSITQTPIETVFTEVDEDGDESYVFKDVNESLVGIYSDTIVENCEIYKAVGYGITLGNKSNLIIKNCVISECQSAGMAVMDSAKGSVDKCDISSNEGYGILIGDNACLSVKDSKIHNTKGNGVMVESGAVLIERCEISENRDLGILVNDYSSSVKECKIFRNGHTGISVRSSDYPTMIKTVIESCEIFENKFVGLHVNDESDPRIEKCLVYKNRVKGIEISNAGGSYVNCNVFENLDDGIYISGEVCGFEEKSDEYPTIENCRVYDGKKGGIAIEEGAEGTIVNCEIYNNEGPGIRVTGENSEATIQKCRIHDGKNNGVLIEDKANAIIEDCDISNNVGQNVQRTGAPVNESSTANSINHPEVNNQNISPAPKPVQNNKPVTEKAPSKVIEKKGPPTTKSNLETPKDPHRQTSIDWSKDTPKTAKEWDALSSEAKQDWFIWHEGQMQGKFAAVAAILEIIAAAFIIYENDSGTGYSVLTGILAFIVLCLTFALRKILYKALRATTMAALLGSFFSFIIYFLTEEGALRIVLYTLAYVLCLALFGYLEAKGALGKKAPSFSDSKS
ncbi:right-handed parallel beta-helix repeat-containing protein [Fibrobacter sp.]|uniref:right-handed parallel beta-helix repeat-containing protein n=1 Tax=Fibrobacter sp. TaxID=35828 RepID=UPI00388EF2C2